MRLNLSSDGEGDCKQSKYNYVPGHSTKEMLLFIHSTVRCLDMYCPMNELFNLKNSGIVCCIGENYM